MVSYVVVGMELTIEGMHCKSCKMLIEGEVGDLGFVKRIEVSLENRKAVVDTEEGNEDTIIKTIEELGFRVQR